LELNGFSQTVAALRSDAGSTGTNHILRNSNRGVASTLTWTTPAATTDVLKNVQIQGTSTGYGALHLVSNSLGRTEFENGLFAADSLTVNSGTVAFTGTSTIHSTNSLEIGAGGTLAYNSSNALTVAPTLSGIDTSNRAVLGGTGTIQASLTLDNVGDTLSPGNSPGIQTYSVNQSWNSFSYDWEVNNFVGTTAGTDFDQIVIDGTLDLTGGTKCYILNLLSLDGSNAAGDVGGFADVNRTWTILATSGTLTGFDAANWTLNTAGFSWASNHTGTFSLGQTGDGLVLSYSVVPAGGVPDGGSTLAMLGTVLGSLAMLRRKFTRAPDSSHRLRRAAR